MIRYNFQSLNKLTFVKLSELVEKRDAPKLNHGGKNMLIDSLLKFHELDKKKRPELVDIAKRDNVSSSGIKKDIINRIVNKFLHKKYPKKASIEILEEEEKKEEKEPVVEFLEEKEPIVEFLEEKEPIVEFLEEKKEKPVVKIKTLKHLLSELKKRKIDVSKELVRLNKLNVKELKNELNKKGINKQLTGKKKDDLIKMLISERCWPEIGHLCDEGICELENNVCISKKFAKENIRRKIGLGGKIIGPKNQIEKLVDLPQCKDDLSCEDGICYLDKNVCIKKEAIPSDFKLNYDKIMNVDVVGTVDIIEQLKKITEEEKVIEEKIAEKEEVIEEKIPEEKVIEYPVIEKTELGIEILPLEQEEKVVEEKIEYPVSYGWRPPAITIFKPEELPLQTDQPLTDEQPITEIFEEKEEITQALEPDDILEVLEEIEKEPTEKIDIVKFLTDDIRKCLGLIP